MNTIQRPEIFRTPMYVLMDGKIPLEPTISPSDICPTRVCIYGFSDKSFYDRFINNVSRMLTPYPLVGGYLGNQIANDVCDDEKNGAVKLVVLDAEAMQQQVVFAATMEAVLKAQLENANVVIAEYQLVWDAGISGYTVIKRPAEGPLKSPDPRGENAGPLTGPPDAMTRKTVIGIP